MIEAHFHRGLDMSEEVLNTMRMPHRDPNPGEMAGLVSGLIGFIFLKTQDKEKAREIIDFCWEMAEETIVEMNSGESENV